MPQQTVSRYENSVLNENDILKKCAMALDVHVSMLKGMAEDAVTFIMENNTFESNRIIVLSVEDCDSIYNNPLDKIIESSNEQARAI